MGAFTREELEMLGLLSDDQQADNKSAEGQATEQPQEGQKSDVVDQLAKKLDDLVSKVSGGKDDDESKQADQPAQQAQEKPLAEQIKELVQAGKTDEALLKIAQLGEMSAVEAVRAQQLVRAQAAKNAFLAKHPEYAKYADELDQLISNTPNADASQLITEEQWKEAFDYVRLRHLDDVVEEEVNKRLQAKQTASSISSGSMAVTVGKMKEPVVLTQRDLESCKTMRIPPERWARNIKILEKYDTKDGQIRNAPLIDRDLTQVDDFGDTIIKPGEF